LNQNTQKLYINKDTADMVKSNVLVFNIQLCLMFVEDSSFWRQGITSSEVLKK